MAKKQLISYLGVDLGSASIKIVELANEDGIPRLLTYGYSEQVLEITKEGTEGQEEKAASIIRKICQKAHTKSNWAVAAIPSFSVFSSIINLPEMSKKDLEAAIYWEAKKFIPIPIEDVILDWKVLKGKIKKIALSRKGFSELDKKLRTKEISPEKKMGKENIRILLTAAPKKLVEKYIKIFQLAELELISLETESFALSRSLVGRDPATVMVIDMGAKTTDIIIMEQSIPIISRSIDIGGENITETIASSSNITRQKAEQFKMDLGLISQEKIPEPIKEILDSIINEIRYSIDLYRTQSGKRVEKIILSGGTACLASLSEYLSKILDMIVYIGDPWSRVKYPVELKPVLKELGPRFAVAVGLAMREIE